VIDEARLREETLSDGRTDHFGLYEIVWSLNAKYPDLPRAVKVDAARRVVVDLLTAGEIRLARSMWPKSTHDPVPADIALALANDPESFDDPKDGSYLCYLTA